MDSTSQIALIIIAIAISVQTLLMIGAAIGAIVAYKRVSVTVEHRLAGISAQMDDVVREARTVVKTVERFGDHAQGVLNGAGNVVRAVATAASAPRALLIAGAASAASGVLSRLTRWRRKSPPTPTTY